MSNQISIDGSSIEGFTRIHESDQYLYPDLDTFTILSWYEQQGKVARLICDVCNPDGTPFIGDPRGALKRTLKRAADMGYTFNVGPECEFFLFEIDKDGKPIKCEGSKCEGDFDWTWTQHTGWRVDSKSDKDVFYLSVFDNGDARGMEQPALPEMKYSRAVVYKIDQKKMTVEQIWEYGKERGHAWYSPVTSLTEYYQDKNSVFVYSATAGAQFNFKTGAFESAPNPYIDEFKWGEKEPAVEIQFKNTSGYQAMPVDLKKAFN